MNFKTLRNVNLYSVLPKEIKDSITCFTFVSSRVINDAPDIVICNTNGYMYEIKNKKIVGSLNLEDCPSFVSHHYIKEQNKLVIFYLVLTKSERLLVIRTTNKRLKVVNKYSEVKDFQVFDFHRSGLPQIKINFTNKLESFIFDFPVEPQVEEKFNELEDIISYDYELSEELEDLTKYIDELNEEYSHLKKICSIKNEPANVDIPVNSSCSTLVLNNLTENHFLVKRKWYRVFGTYLVLGMDLRNIGKKIIDGLDVIITHEKIRDYTFTFFQPSADISKDLFSARQFDGIVDIGDDVCIVCSFEVPQFDTESVLNIVCCVTSKDLKDCFVKAVFEINVCDVALQTTVDLEERFNFDDLAAMITVNQATHMKIQTEDLEDDVMESLFTNHLGFKLIKNMKDKLFYCTSTYLKEVFVALQHVAKNPSVWKMVTYTRQNEQIYFLVNALYDLLPENSAVLCDENTDLTG